MNKQDAIALIDAHKNKLINPVEMLHWTWIRVIINQMPDDVWDAYSDMAEREVMSQ
jgi:hypothetical protein